MGLCEPLVGTFKRCFGRIHRPGKTGAELCATAKPTGGARSLGSAQQRSEPVWESLCPIYLGKGRRFISTSEQNVRLRNTGDEEENEAFFFLEKRKCCEIVQEQPPVSTLSPASRSFYITGLTELGSGVRVGVRVRRSQRRNGGLGPVPDLQLLPLPSEPIKPHGLASHCRRRSQRSDRPEAASPPPHTPVPPWKDPLWGLLTRASLKDN